jgi:hypothetical protein
MFAKVMTTRNVQSARPSPAVVAHLRLKHRVVVLEEQALELVLKAPFHSVVVGGADRTVLGMSLERQSHGQKQGNGERDGLLHESPFRR